MPDKVNRKLAGNYADVFVQAIQNNYGKTNGGYTSEEAGMLRSLADNACQFAGAKAYQQTKALAQSLIENGSLQTHSEFQQLADVVNSDHKRWFQTEYDSAVSSAQMAKKWAEIQQNKDRLGILEFDAVMDGRTTELCAGLNGVRKSADDAFWDTYYPPNHYNCRSTVRQQSGGATTPDGDIDYPDIPPAFQTNLAKQGVAFPPQHSYYQDCPKEYLNMYATANFTKQGKNLFVTGLNIEKGKEDDVRAQKQAQMRLDAASSLADYFNDDIYVLPEIKPTDPRNDLYFTDTPVAGKQTDYLINGNYYELESYEKSFKLSKITNMLKSGVEQSDRLVLKLNHNADMNIIKNKIMTTLKDSQKLRSAIKEIIVIDKNGKVYRII